MKSLQLMNLANIRGNTRAKSTMSQHQSEYEVFLLLYLYKHADQPATRTGDASANQIYHWWYWWHSHSYEESKISDTQFFLKGKSLQDCIQLNLRTWSLQTSQSILGPSVIQWQAVYLVRRCIKTRRHHFTTCLRSIIWRLQTTCLMMSWKISLLASNEFQIRQNKMGWVALRRENGNWQSTCT